MSDLARSARMVALTNEVRFDRMVILRRVCSRRTPPPMEWPEHPFFAHSLSRVVSCWKRPRPRLAAKLLRPCEAPCIRLSPRRFFKHEEKNGCSGLLFLVGAAQTQTAHFFPFEPLASGSEPLNPRYQWSLAIHLYKRKWRGTKHMRLARLSHPRAESRRFEEQYKTAGLPVLKIPLFIGLFLPFLRTNLTS